MNKPIQAKSSPEVKPWVRRVVAAAGVVLPATPDGEKRLGCWGVEMAKIPAVLQKYAGVYWGSVLGVSR